MTNSLKIAKNKLFYKINASSRRPIQFQINVVCFRGNVWSPEHIPAGCHKCLGYPRFHSKALALSLPSFMVNEPNNNNNKKNNYNNNNNLVQLTPN